MTAPDPSGTAGGEERASTINRITQIRKATEAALPEALAPFEAIANEPRDVRHNKTDSYNRRVFAFREAASPTAVLALLDVAEAARTTNHVYTPDGADSAACAICSALSRLGVRREPSGRPEPECPACEQPRGHAGDCIPSIGVIASANPQKEDGS